MIVPILTGPNHKGLFAPRQGQKPVLVQWPTDKTDSLVNAAG